jgi:hypothetical protein
MSGKGKSKGKRRGEKEEWKPTPNRPIVKARIVPLEQMASAVADSVSELRKYTLVLDDPEFTATTFWRFRDTVHLDVINPVHVDPEAIRVKILLALRDGKVLFIDMKKIEENLVKLFDTVQEGLFQAMFTVGGEWYTQQYYRALVLPEDKETLDIEAHGFTARPGFGLVVALISDNPPAVLIDNFAVVRVVGEGRKPPTILTDTKNPAGLEIKKKKKKKKKSTLFG